MLARHADTTFAEYQEMEMQCICAENLLPTLTIGALVLGTPTL